eukprot:TRINITY_DN72988_c0_g1_i1.p1 TRINITY_DN72988_c0_g1~~TRINITY_DN72988_c0_g1_i1.p1  ORF type:complete len:324 (-),score=108.01 TRINITY_DN72988_c0_g1_i1:210-1181(-)
MKLVIQRVEDASVEVDSEIVGAIGRGLMVLLGIEHGDTLEQVNQLATKLLKTRLWPDLKDPNKQWASSVVDNGYGLLVVSQFTLFATFKKPKPDFHQAMGGEEAKKLYEAFVQRCRSEYQEDKVKTGSFGAMMKVRLCNDGPVTVELVAAPGGANGGSCAGSNGAGSAKSAAGGKPPAYGAAGANGGAAAKSATGARAAAAAAAAPGAGAATAAAGAAKGAPELSSAAVAAGAALEDLLTQQPYIAGFEPSSRDAELFARLQGCKAVHGSERAGDDGAQLRDQVLGALDLLRPRNGCARGSGSVARWYEHVASFTDLERSAWS